MLRWPLLVFKHREPPMTGRLHRDMVSSRCPMALSRPGAQVMTKWGFPQSWGYPHSWMVLIMENLNLKWMIWGYPYFRKPPNKVENMGRAFGTLNPPDFGAIFGPTHCGPWRPQDAARLGLSSSTHQAGSICDPCNLSRALVVGK